MLHSDFRPAGDQPTAIAELVEGVTSGERNQVLLGATGTGKTFTVAKVIEATQRPAIVLAPNKTLAAQLYGEFKGFFPENAVEYFVSYYDYYQPEAYVPRTDTYIEKESQINEQIDRMRHSATRALLGARRRDHRRLGLLHLRHRRGRDLRRHDPGPRRRPRLRPAPGHRRPRRAAVPPQRRRLPARQLPGAGRFARALAGAPRGPRLAALSFFGEELESVHEFDPLTGARTDALERVRVYANSHYVTPRPTLQQAIKGIRAELAVRLDQLVKEGKLLEAQRLEQRCNFDLEMLEATGSCNGIENYSRYLTGRKPGEPPPTLFEYIPDHAIVFADEIATSACRRSAACTAATTAASSPSPSTASACPPAWTTAR